MFTGASHTIAHDLDDHDEHETELDGECVVCTIASVNAVKIGPIAQSIVKPEPTSVGNGPIGGVLNTDLLSANPKLARGPPAPFPSY